MAKKDKKQAKQSAASAADGDERPVLTLASDPRAMRRVAEAKAWGGLTGFALGGYLSLPTHTLTEAALRALLAGVVCYVAVWAAAVFLWRRLLVAELRHAEHELLATELAKLQGAGAAPTVERGRAPAVS
jgi:hypothetical protein